MGSHILNLPIVQLNSTEEGFQQFIFFCCASHPVFLSPPLSPLLPLSLISFPSPFYSPSTLFFFFFSLQTVESGICSHTSRVASLNTAREELIHTSSTENAAEVQESLKDLNNKCTVFELLKIEH